ncbi:MAG: DnaD domain protein [Lachnospiraceae bacterium]|nr:DnaD domain protein [Lachnospiraceae bacterium]
MKTLTIKNRFQGNTTIIENEFIDTYMAKANGEFVKVYLFLLRHLNNPCTSLTISIIADCLEDTEKDILRALKYWEKIGLLSIEYNEEKQITGLELGSIADGTSKPPALSNPLSIAKIVKIDDPILPKVLKSTKDRKELKQLLFVSEQYIGKTLTKTDVDTISYFYDSLHFSSDLIEYLIEYCVENGHKSMHYIQSVALAWSDAKITTLEEAKAHSNLYNKNCFTILKAFGISGRNPAASEKNYIEKWINDSGFTLDIIKEACDRTMANIHQPSFEYADSILSNWKDKGVKHLPDIDVIDTAYKQNQSNRKKVTTKKITTNKFNNFEGRSYDIDSLEEQLLNSK